MKKMILFAVVCAFIAAPAYAGMWELDKDTALGLTTSSVTTGFATANTLTVYDGPLTKVYGTGPAIYGNMAGEVGFFGGLAGDTLPGTAVMEISFTGALALSGSGFDGITAFVANDNQSLWSYQLFYVDSVYGERTSGWVELPPLGGNTYITAPASSLGSLDLSNVTNIGLRVKGQNMGGTDDKYPSYSDDFHVSLVPVPAAMLLGVLGLGTAGLRLRRRS